MLGANSLPQLHAGKRVCDVPGKRVGLLHTPDNVGPGDGLLSRCKRILGVSAIWQAFFGYRFDSPKGSLLERSRRNTIALLQRNTFKGNELVHTDPVKRGQYDRSQLARIRLVPAKGTGIAS